MPMSLPLRHRLSLACAAVLLLAPTLLLAAKRETANVEELNSRMQAAESRFTKASIGVRNDDPGAQAESDAALQDMEDVMNACIRLRGCPVNTFLASYNRLLKQAVDTDADDGDDEPAADSIGHEGVAANVPEAARAAALLSEDHRFDRMVEYNPAVQQAIRRWLTDMRGSLISSYENYQALRYVMWPEYERRGLPEALLFGIMAKESNGKVHATSRTGAAGLMQFMPATGRRFGLGDDGTGFDTRYDARSAAQASAEYLNERMGQLNRNIELALAAYNGGEGRALRVYQGTGAKSFWDESVYNQFPAETRDYVPMVIGASWLFMHPKEYGLTFPKVSAKPAPLRLTQPASIYQLTVCLGNKGVHDGYMRTLRNLNPRYQPETFLPTGTVLNANTKIVGAYNRWCTSGARADLARTLVLSDPSRAIVRTGPLQTIPSDDADGDGVPSGAVPAGPSASTSPVVAPAPVAAKPTPARDERRSAKADDAEADKPGRKAKAPRSYRVQTGESLSTIARKFGCDVDDLAKANGIKHSNALKRGQALKLPSCEG
ncbi:LysM peptidoglycan-binding domain-containing protein [Lysobacter sp. TY2-98]|uniref:transglycosylase SLT domain-containing protein n=1 Tax=Lysobacter sp. TY2-98 TaxID=2290922 RepID=UPI000E1FDB1E|nr:transglycosylase SLT domain-containing protein [Lysobacter sp. TY2-98]AXK73591.1 LysM peptidoglycan-binding domain-containing protein [Lysobacter sp. TY2-98]